VIAMRTELITYLTDGSLISTCSLALYCIIL